MNAPEPRRTDFSNVSYAEAVASAMALIPTLPWVWRRGAC